MQGIPENRSWAARWIWDGSAGRAQNSYCYVRKRFAGPASGAGCRLLISADTRYQLFLNGAFIGRGPAQSQPFYQYYDEYDVADLLVKDTNILALVVNHLGTIPDTRPGLLLEIVDADGTPLVATDDSWRITRAAPWQENTHCYRGNKMTPFQEFFDARKEPDGWQDVSFDDSSWSPAQPIGGRSSSRPPCAGPWSRLVPRDIPFMTSTPVRPAQIERIEEGLDLNNRSRPTDLAPGLSMVGGPLQYCVVENADALCETDGSTTIQCSTRHRDLNFDGLYAPAIVLDFGKVITARARLELDGAAGGMVEIGYAERLVDGHFNIAMECEFADRYTMRDGRQTFESFTWKAFRYLKLRFRRCYDPVKLHSVEGVVTTFPYEDRGAFHCEDETIRRVFDISRETLRLCSNECLMDTPWREQAQWLGDVALVTVPAIESCFGDTALTHKFFIQAGQNQHPTGMISNVSNVVNHGWLGAIPDYSLWWVCGLWEHYLYSGDASLLHRLYPQALRILDAHLGYINRDGLVEDMPYWTFIDWADVDKQGISSAYNAIFYGTLARWRELAAARSDTYVVEQVDTLRGRMSQAFHAALFDPARQCYADARIDGTFSSRISEQANMSAIWAGLSSGQAALDLVDTVFHGEQVFTEAQPFFMAVVLRALAKAGRFDLALDLIRQRWGKRMVDRGYTSVTEEWYHNGSWRSGEFDGFLRTHSHAWSGCPADFLIRNMLGLEILEPGCTRVRVAPQSPGFDYDLTFPTPGGQVRACCTDGQTEVTCDGDVELITNTGSGA